MTRVTCRLTAQNRDQVRNPPLGNRVWANFTILIHNSSLNTSTHSARKVGFIFDKHLTFSDQSYLQKSASYLMNTSPSLTSRLSKSCYYHIVSFAVSIHTSTQKNIFHHHHFHCSLQARLLQLSLSQPAKVSDHPAPTDPELTCTCCCRSSQIQSHHSPILWSLHWLKITERIEY